MCFPKFSNLKIHIEINDFFIIFEGIITPFMSRQSSSRDMPLEFSRARKQTFSDTSIS